LSDDVGDELSLLDFFLAFPSDLCCSSDLFFPSLAAELPLLPPQLLVFACAPQPKENIQHTLVFTYISCCKNIIVPPSLLPATRSPALVS
jgi:hypothetical protein